MNTVKLKEFKPILTRVIEEIFSLISRPFWYIVRPKRFAQRLMKYDIVSFDIFDTLILRKVPHPADLFGQLEKKLEVEGFREKRISSEKEARVISEKPCGEIDIFDIYRQLKSEIPIDLNEGVNAEFEMEKFYCYANPYMKAVFYQLQKCGKEIIAVSDMYLPENLLAELLERTGYEGFFQIFVSCECGCGKGSGKLQRLVSQTIGPEKRIVHIGDSLLSDVLMSRRAGWHAIWYPKQKRFDKS